MPLQVYLALTVFCFAICALLGTAIPAQAAQTRLLQSNFNASDAPPTARAPLSGVIAVAVDNSGTATDGRVYVGDVYNDVVDVFDPTGKYLSQFDTPSIPYGIAVDQTNGNVYVADFGGGFVSEFDPAGKLIKAFGPPEAPGEEYAATGIAFDTKTGELYVADFGHSAIDVFNSSGEYQRQFSSISSVLSLAIDSQGNLFAANGSEAVVYDAATGELNPSYGGGSGVLDPNSSVGLGVDPATDEVYVSGAGHVAGYDKTGAPVLDFGQGQLSNSTRDVAAGDTAGRVYVADEAGAHVAIFGPQVTVPDVTTGPVESPRPTSGTFTGHLDPVGAGNVTACHFEYGTDTSYGSELPCTPAPPYAAATNVEAHASGLTNEVTYHYRLVVSNANGPNFGQDQTYTTPPAVAGLNTEPPSNITPNCVRLNGSFTANGEDTHYYFQWGTDTGYGHVTSTVDAGSGTGPTTEFADLCGLVPQTTYHYRIVASNPEGTSFGGDKVFTTPPAVADLAAEPPANVTPTGATLQGSFTGNGKDTHYYFEWGTEAGVYVHNTPFPSADAGSPPGPEATALSVGISELLPATNYYYRLVASNSFGATVSNEEHLLTPPGPPLVNASVSDVHSESALLHAKIDPQGANTTYHFEYGTADCSSSPCESTPMAEVKAGNRYIGVSAPLGGLTVGTLYHYRIVATNSAQTTPGPDQTFTTFPFFAKLNEGCPNALARQQTGAALLLDCRAYELVSAANTGGYDVSSDLSEGDEAPFGGYPEAESPPRVLYSVDHGAIPGTDHPTNKGSDPYVATRTESGWSTEYIGVPANDLAASASEPFSSLTSGADAALDAFAFGAPGGCSPCFEGGYTGIPVRFEGKLVQGMLAASNVPAPGPAAKPDGYIASDLSANGEHLIFGSTSLFAKGGNDETGDVSIYDRDLKTGETHVVSNTPKEGEDGPEPLPCLQGAGQCHSPGDTDGISELAISADGSHILLGQLTGESEGAKLYHLYMNVGDSIRTVDLTPSATQGVRFDGMSADGKKVFFSSEEHLTGEDEGHTGADIYLAEEGQPLALVSTGTEADAFSCDPAATTLRQHWNTTGAKNCGDVAIGGGGGVASGDGTFYFLSPSLLDGSAEPADGVQSAPNLYVSRPGQLPHFVATLESTLTGPLLSRHPLLRGIGTLNTPTLVAVDDSGGPSNTAIYALEGTTIYKLAPDGSPVTAWREDGKLSNGGYPPIHGIAVDPSNGVLYIDQLNEIIELTKEGSFIRSFNVTGGVNGIAVDSAGNVYIHTPYNTISIQKFSRTGEELGVVVPNISTTGIAVDPSNGDLYLDNNGETVERYAFNGAGEVISDEAIVSGLSSAAGLSVDASHDVFVDERGQVAEFNSSGEEISVPIGAGLLHGSTGVAADSAGNVYADNPSHSNLAEFGPPEPSPNPRTDNPLVVDAVSEPEARKTADFQLTPSGRFAAFASTLPLTGAEGGGFPEVFRYDVAAEKLACASCNPSGAEATGGSSLAANGSSLTEAGQVFFNSEEPLALRDSDNLTDVYEWEPAGTGTCDSESPTFSRASGDCLGLISTGSSPFNSKLLGVSLNGTDAYFFTRDTLAPQDENGELVKIYDARVEGGFFVTPEPPLCKSSDECHGAGSPPPPPPDFNPNTGRGGNEVPATKCKKGFVEKHGACVKKPSSHKHHHVRHERNKKHRAKHHRKGSVRP